jgi:hypothetical protein
VTIYDNAQSVPVGGRAAGMGGAYTALACDEGALHYNPVSLSCAAASHLELTANAYVLQGCARPARWGRDRTCRPPRSTRSRRSWAPCTFLSEGSERTFFDAYSKLLVPRVTGALRRALPGQRTTVWQPKRTSILGIFAPPCDCAASQDRGQRMTFVGAAGMS